MLSLSKTLEKTVAEIKTFHNKYCDEENIIIDDINKKIKIFYVHPNTDGTKIKLQELVLLKQGKLAPAIPINKKICYGVIYTIINGEEESTLKYECSVQSKGKLENNIELVEIDRLSTTFLNDEEVNSIADELAYKTASIIYPIELAISANGNIEGIGNMELIKKRWTENKEKLLEEYEGDFIEEYIEACEKSLLDEYDLLNALDNDYFLNTYFNNIHIAENSNLEKKVFFPTLCDCRKLEYKVTQQFDKYVDDDNFICITQKGVLNDERSKVDLEERRYFPFYSTAVVNKEKAEGNYRTVYYLNKDSRIIEHAFLECDIKLKETLKSTVSISVLENSI